MELTLEEEEAILARADGIRELRRRRQMAQADETAERLKNGPAFLDNELVYAATARCACGVGLAYPRDIGVQGAWYCASRLLDRAQWGAPNHDDAWPFMYWSIKSESQPSANGATTRPAS